MINREKDDKYFVNAMIMAFPMDTNDEDLPKFESLEEYVEDGNLFICLSLITLL